MLSAFPHSPLWYAFYFASCFVIQIKVTGSSAENNFGAPVKVHSKRIAIRPVETVSWEQSNPNCYSEKLTSKTQNIRWVIQSQLVLGNSTTQHACCSDCDSPASFQIQVRRYGDAAWTCAVDSQLDLVPLGGADGIHYTGLSCQYGDIWLVATSSCPTELEVDITVELFDVSEDSSLCREQKIQEQNDARQGWLLAVYYLVCFLVTCLGIIVCCMQCLKGACGRCCRCCKVHMTYTQKSEWVRLINRGGHSRWYTVNLLVTGILWLETQVYLPLMDPPPGVRLDPLSGVNLHSPDDGADDAAAVVEQFKGFIHWMSTMSLCVVLGFMVYCTILLNYTVRGHDKSPATVTVSVCFLAALNCCVGIQVSDSYALMGYFRHKAPFAFLYAMLLLHMLVTDILAVDVVCRPRRLEAYRSGVGPKRIGPVARLAARVPRLRRLRAWVLEDESFQYNAWMLAAMAVALHILLFSFMLSVSRLFEISVCLSDVERCLEHGIADFFFIPTRQVIETIVPKDFSRETDMLHRLENAYQDIFANFSEFCNKTETAMQTLEAAAMGSAAGGNTSQALPDGIDLLYGPVREVCGAAQLELAQQTVGSVLDAYKKAFLGMAVPELVQGTGGVNLTGAADQAAGLAIETAAALLRDFSHILILAASVGYSCGLCAGLYALVLTLAKYKKLVKQIRRHELCRLFGTGKEAAVDSMVISAEGIRSRTHLLSSVFFAGIVVSTAFIQLQVFGVLITGIIAVFGYRPFWTDVATRFWGYAASIVFVLLMNGLVMRGLIGRRVTDGRSIITARGWVAYYMIFSFAQIAFGLLLAIVRIVMLLITSVFAMNRLDINLFTTGQRFDNGYNSFMGMVAMVQAMQAKEMRCWQRVRHIIKTPRFQEYKKSLGDEEQRGPSQSRRSSFVLGRPIPRVSNTQN
mmetsp:Transcript_28943/g.69122  ORF Transcript_28943/g.69122 Transcript_28943/m.69122 type:complete len:918 (-) Transcript_28943:548-3301(-)